MSFRSAPKSTHDKVSASAEGATPGRIGSGESPRGGAMRLVAGLLAILLFASLAFCYRLYREQERHRAAAQDARRRADELVDWMLFQLRDQLEPIGRVEILEMPARKALDYLSSLPITEDTPAIRHRRGVALDNIGQVMILRGDLPAARSAFRQALEVAERLCREEPDNPAWQRGAAIGYSHIGDLEQQQSADGLPMYRKALEIFNRLAEQQPEDRERQYDLGLAHERLGTALQARGELSEALKHYQSRQIIASTMNTLDPNDTVWRRDLAISYGTIGDALDALGDGTGAAAAYQKFAEHAGQLAAQNPDNTEWHRDFAISQQKLGDLRASQGDIAAARGAYLKFAEIGDRLAALEPENVQSQRDLAASRIRLAALQEKMGKLVESAALQQQASEILARLAAKLGTEEARREAGQAWGKLAWYFLLQRQPEKSLAAARTGHTLASSDPRVELRLAHALLFSGRWTEAAAVYRRNRAAVVEGERGFAQFVTEDFRILKIRGVLHPDMKRIEAELKPAN